LAFEQYHIESLDNIVQKNRMSQFTFQIDFRDGRARRGRISTPRGEIRTPAFMPVGTAGTVKAMLPASVAATGADIVLSAASESMPSRNAAIVALWHNPDLRLAASEGPLTSGFQTFGPECRFTVAFRT
jgi:hypothetical protein